MAKTDITRLWIEATFSTGLSLPKVCKPSIPGMKIKPTLDVQRNREMLNKQSLNCNNFHTNNKGCSGSLERWELDVEQKNVLHPFGLDWNYGNLFFLSFFFFVGTWTRRGYIAETLTILNNKRRSGSSEKRALDVEQKSALHLWWSDWNYWANFFWGYEWEEDTVHRPSPPPPPPPPPPPLAHAHHIQAQVDILPLSKVTS